MARPAFKSGKRQFLEMGYFGVKNDLFTNLEYHLLVIFIRAYRGKEEKVC